jgi:prevent-host-death family protein
MNVSVREFKARLSRYIRAAHSGKDVVITSRGKAVARLTPVGEETRSNSPSREELLRKLKTIPGIRIGTGERLSGSRNPIKIRSGEKTMSEIVIEGRGPR